MLLEAFLLPLPFRDYPYNWRYDFYRNCYIVQTKGLFQISYSLLNCVNLHKWRIYFVKRNIAPLGQILGNYDTEQDLFAKVILPRKYVGEDGAAVCKWEELLPFLPETLVEACQPYFKYVSSLLLSRHFLFLRVLHCVQCL